MLQNCGLTACGVRLACDCPAGIADRSVKFQNLCPRFLGNRSFRGEPRFRNDQHILAWLQIGAVVMGENLIAMLVAQLPNSASPFR